MDERGEEQSKGPIPPCAHDLIERICSGDHEAISELLFDRGGRAIAHLVHKFSYPELWGDLYIAFNKNDWQKLLQWRGECSLESWVWKVAISLCLERARREKRIVFVEPEKLLNHTGSLSPDFDYPLRRRDVMRAIEALKDPRQRAILFGVLQNEPIEQIAETLRITRNNADVLKKRAIDHLKEILQRREREQSA